MLIKELFSEYIEDIPNSIGKGEIIKITHTEDLKRMTIYASFQNVQKTSYVIDFENSMRKSLGIDELSLMCRYAPNLLSEDYFPEITEKLKRIMSVVNGYLNGAVYTLQNDTPSPRTIWRWV
jgi:hypothetical protein